MYIDVLYLVCRFFNKYLGFQFCCYPGLDGDPSEADASLARLLHFTARPPERCSTFFWIFLEIGSELWHQTHPNSTYLYISHVFFIVFWCFSDQQAYLLDNSKNILIPRTSVCRYLSALAAELFAFADPFSTQWRFWMPGTYGHVRMSWSRPIRRSLQRQQ